MLVGISIILIAVYVTMPKAIMITLIVLGGLKIFVKLAKFFLSLSE